jgi:hypothetical protein
MWWQNIWFVGLYSESAHCLFALLFLPVLLRLMPDTHSISSPTAKWIGYLLIILLCFSLGYLSHVFADWFQFLFGKDWV